MAEVSARLSSTRVRKSVLVGVDWSYARLYLLRYLKYGDFVRWISRRRGMAQGCGTPCDSDGTCSSSQAHDVRVAPSRMSLWSSTWCERTSALDADVAVDLARAWMSWVSPLFTLSKAK
ncbi:hypothetical protein BHM03_00017714 [Ensete ventricosum]|nr:hypothetical protein BHM03_00017714 [Ensete ventricosum]